MISAYNPLIHKTANETQVLTSLILQHRAVQCIFLLGAAKQYRKTATIFAFNSPTASCTAHYYILVLLEKGAEHTRNVVQDKLENTLQHFIPTTVLTLGTDAFIQMLTKGYSFALRVLTKAERLFQSENLIFPTAPGISRQEHNDEHEGAFIQAKRIIEGFLASAELQRCKGDYQLSAFMLHQAAEQALRTMVMLCTGYRPTTHSLDKLLRYASMVCPALPEVFQRQREKEKSLFALLSRAYIEARYRKDYTLSAEDLQQLTQKVKRIQHLFEQQCRSVVDRQHPQAQYAHAEG